MKITIKRVGEKWHLTFDNGKPVVKYGSLLKLAKALLAYAIGEKL